MAGLSNLRMRMTAATIDGPVWIPTLPPSIGEYLAPNLQPIPLIPIIALVLAATYLLGATTLWRRHVRWSVIRTLAFLIGCLVTVVVTGAGIEGYGYEIFSVFMFQQVTLMMIIPPLLVCGSPGTLLLKATPHSGAGLVLLRVALMGLRSPVSKVLIHPAVTLSLLVTSFYGLYFTGVSDHLLQSWTGHVGLELFFLVAGVLFAVPLFSTDPLPHRFPYGGKLLEVFIKMPLHVIFGVIVMLSSSQVVTYFASPPPSWGVDAILDQRIAGALAWSYGEFPSLIILLMLLVRWQHDEGVRTRAADKRRDRDGDVDLDAYNAYLNRLR